MPDFYTVVTDTGLQALGLASTQGQSFSLTQAVVGDGNGLAVIPNKGMTTLVNEVWRGNVAGIKVAPDDPNTFIFEFAIPADTGGFTIREVGLLDENGKLFCIGNFPDTEKPVAVNGSVRDLVVRLPLHFENADVVNLVIDTAVVLATKQDVLDHNADSQAHGIMKSDAVTSSSSVKVATSKAVKTVNDKIVMHEAKENRHVPTEGNTGDVLLKTESGAKWKKLALVPAGHIYPVPFPPNELPAHHYVPNGEGILKTSEAGQTLLSMSAAYKTAHSITENATHVFLPNVFDTNGDGYFPRFVDGVNRKVGSKQSDAIRNIKSTASMFSAPHASVQGYETPFYKIKDAHADIAVSTQWQTHEIGFDASLVVPTAHETRPNNYGFTPAIYLPPLGDI